MRLALTGRLEQALAAAEKAASDYPEYSEFVRLQSRALEGLNWEEESEKLKAKALERFSRLARERPDSAIIQASAAHIHDVQELDAEAEKYFNSSEKLAPSDARPFLLRSTSLPKEEIEASIRLQERAVELEPVNALARVTLGHSYSEEGDLPEAARQFREALKLAPEQGWVGAFAVLFQFASDSQTERALADSTPLAERFPNDGWVQMVHAMALSFSDADPGEIESQYHKAIALSEGFSLPLLEYARWLLRTGRLDEADRQFRIALDAPGYTRENPEHPIPPEYGQLLAQAGRQAEAEPLLRKLVERAPNNPDYMLAYVNFLEFLGRGGAEEIEEKLRDFVDRNPEDWKVLSRLGLWLAGNGRLDEADESFQNAARHAASSRDLRAEAIASVHADWAHSRLDLEQWTEALGILENAIGEQSDLDLTKVTPKLRWTLWQQQGIACQSLSRLDEAEGSFVKAMEAGEEIDSPEGKIRLWSGTLEQLTTLYLADGQLKKAEQQARRWVEIDSENPFALIHLAAVLHDQKKPETEWRPLAEQAIALGADRVDPATLDAWKSLLDRPGPP